MIRFMFIINVGYLYYSLHNSTMYFKIYGTKNDRATTFDSPYPISYSCSIVRKPLSPALFEILDPKDNWPGHDLDFSRSRDVIGHVTIPIPIPLFLFVLHCDQTPISCRYQVHSEIRNGSSRARALNENGV